MNQLDDTKYYCVDGYVLKQERSATLPMDVVRVLGLDEYNPSSDIEARRQHWRKIQLSGRLRNGLMMILEICHAPEGGPLAKSLPEILAAMPTPTTARVVKDFVDLNFTLIYPN